MLRSIRKVLREKKGVAALEYSILAGMIVLAVVGALNTSKVGESLDSIFTQLGTALSTAAGTGDGGTNGGGTNGGGTNP